MTSAVKMLEWTLVLLLGTVTAAAQPRPQVFTIKGSVTDARTGKPVPGFRVVRAPADNAPGRPPSPWQGHTVTKHADGTFEIPLERAWAVTRLRVDADGYLPAVSKAIEKQPGVVTADFALEPGEGVRGTVLTPDGKPAAGAQVTWATITNEMSVKDGRLAPSGHGVKLGTIAATAADGSFRLPPEVDPGTIVVAHESGYAEVASGTFRSGEQVHLDGWASITGRLDVPGGLGGDWSVAVSSARPNGPSPYVSHYAVVPLDAEGRFKAQRLAPGRHSACVVLKTGTGHSSVTGTYADVSVEPGKALHFTLGGRGRPVTGRVVAAGKAAGAVDWSKVKLRLILEAPHIGFPGDNEIRRAYQAFLADGRAAAYQRDFTPAADGSFRLDNVPQGRYQLIGPVRFGSRVVVPPMPGGRSDEPMHLGDIPLSGEPPVKQGATGDGSA